MAKGKKTGGRNFQKGQSGNPKGCPRIPEDIKEARKLTQFEFERIANKYLYAKKEDIALASRDPDTPLIELMIGSIIHKAVIEGDERRLDFLVTRLIGKIVQPLSHTGPSNGPILLGYENKTKEEIAQEALEIGQSMVNDLKD